MGTPPDYAALAQAVDKRFKELKLRPQDVHREHLSRSTFDNIRNGVGRVRGFDPQSLLALARAMRWTPESPQAVLDGGAPTPLPDGEEPVVPFRPRRELRVDSSATVELLAEIAALSVLARRTLDEVQSLRDDLRLQREAAAVAEEVFDIAP